MWSLDPLYELGLVNLFESLFADFVLALTFFTALAYAVLNRRFEHQRSAVAISTALGLALAVGLVWWEQDHGWSIRDLGPVAVGFGLLVLAVVMYQALSRAGGKLVGAAFTFGASLLIASLLELPVPLRGVLIQLVALGLIGAGIAALVVRRRRDPPANVSSPETESIHHDLSDLFVDRQMADRITERLKGLRDVSGHISERPGLADQVRDQLRHLLPAEGQLTEHLARFREKMALAQQGQMARINELQSELRHLPPEMRESAGEELAARIRQLRLDRRLDRLDRSVAEAERRLRDLTVQAERALENRRYDVVPDLLDTAARIQQHAKKLLEAIDRTERKLLRAAEEAARAARGPAS